MTTRGLVEQDLFYVFWLQSISHVRVLDYRYPLLRCEIDALSLKVSDELGQIRLQLQLSDVIECSVERYSLGRRLGSLVKIVLEDHQSVYLSPVDPQRPDKKNENGIAIREMINVINALRSGKTPEVVGYSGTTHNPNLVGLRQVGLSTPALSVIRFVIIILGLVVLFVAVVGLVQWLLG